jgi:alpha-L-fucosidase
MSSFRISRRQLIFTTGVTGAAAAAGLLRGGTAKANAGPQSYTATWSSVDQHPPAPVWFQDAKFGIYYHWGVFSVPAFSNEWYPRNMYNSGSIENQHHIATYGDPSAWPYHLFMLGANNKAGQLTKFQPKLVSNGGSWDPNAWAALFKAAGARRLPGGRAVGGAAPAVGDHAVGVVDDAVPPAASGTNCHCRWTTAPSPPPTATRSRCGTAPAA